MSIAFPCRACRDVEVESAAALRLQGWTTAQIQDAISRYGPAMCPRHQREADRIRKLRRLDVD